MKMAKDNRGAFDFENLKDGFPSKNKSTMLGSACLWRLSCPWVSHCGWSLLPTMAYCAHSKSPVLKFQVAGAFKHERRNIPHCSSYSLLFQPSLIVLVILTIEHHQDNAMILQRGRMTVSLLLFKNVLQYVVRLALLNSGREISSHGVTLYNKEHLHLGNTLIHRCSVLSLLPLGSVPESLLTEKIRLCLE